MNTVTADLTISLDGFIAGPRQSLENPLGEGGEKLHRWMFEQPEENASEIAEVVNAGAFIMGRNMFGPIRGEWSDDWRGWWGDDPPYHAPVLLGSGERIFDDVGDLTLEPLRTTGNSLVTHVCYRVSYSS